MDDDIEGIDEATYEAIERHAASTGRTVADILQDALEAYLARRQPPSKTGSFHDLPKEDFGPGNEALSQRVDEVLY